MLDGDDDGESDSSPDSRSTCGTPITHSRTPHPSTSTSKSSSKGPVIKSSLKSSHSLVVGSLERRVEESSFRTGSK